MSEEKYKKAAHIIVKAGILPTPVNQTLIDILKTIFQNRTNEINNYLKYSNKIWETSSKVNY